MTEMRRLVMKYAGGGIVRHLGLQNYKGAVPALAELIANAWDADSEKVVITIPCGRNFRPGDEIRVRDFGSGMTWEDCDNKYLVIGRNRREEEKTDVTSGGRPLMAHKGLGKLAGFGIAKILEVRTISNGKLTHFRMSFSDLDKLKQGDPYPPEMIADEKPVKEEEGTEIILKDLTLQQAVNEKQYRDSMSRRFSIYSNKFKVYINNKLIKRRDIKTEFRFPEETNEEVNEIDEGGYGHTILSNGGVIKWWIGFTPNTIKLTDYSGVTVLARGRVAQDPWNFNLAGGTWGQHGLRYLTGEIIAEFVDEGISYETDTILTNRSGINWELPINRPLYNWTQKKIKSLLKVWSQRRGKKTFDKVKKENPVIVEKMKRFPPREQKELNHVLRSLAQIPTIKKEKLARLANNVIDAYEDKAFQDVIGEITALPPEDMEKTMDILNEFDIFEAIRVHRIVSSHVKVIRRFETMIDEGVREKPDMHDYIMKYPWLLGIKHQTLDHEKTLQKILEKKFGIKTSDEHRKKRPDFFCMRSGGDVVVIELKRPGEKIGGSELQQTFEYVYYLRDWVKKGNPKKLTGVTITPRRIIGFLIGYDIKNDPIVRGQIELYDKDGIHVCKWTDLLMAAREDHEKFLKIIKRRAPKDDPRILDLQEIS